MIKYFNSTLNSFRQIPLEDKREWITLFIIYPFSLIFLLVYFFKYNFKYHVSEFNDELLISFTLLTLTLIYGIITHKKNQTLVSYLFLATFTICFFIYVSGGVESPGLFWLTFLGPIYGLFYRKKGILVGAIVSAIAFFIYIYLHKMDLIPTVITQQANYQTEKNTNFFTFLIFMSINFFAYAKAHERALKSLKDKNEQIESLLRILFHDVANPLAVITLSSDVMLKRKNFTEEGVQRISRAALNLKEQLESVKKLKTIKDGKYVLEINECYIKQMLDSAIDIFSEKCQSKKITILTEYDDQTLKIKVDFIVFVNQIISNILSNSIKFSHPDSEILIKVKKLDESVQIIIQDFGIGMSDEISKHLFDTEKVTSRSGTEKESGAGYGISLAKYFIESLAGTLEVQSREQIDNSTDHGTTFTITFPR